MKKPEVNAETLVSQLNQQKQSQDQWTVIQNLNKLYKVDHILLKHAYKNYPQKEVIEQSKQYKNIEKFYRYVFDNLFEIEKSYLIDQINPTEGTKASNYQINKNNTSKFVRDQKEKYQTTFKLLAKKVNDEESCVNGKDLFRFTSLCFDTKFTSVILLGQPYFDKKQTRKEEFENLVKSYYCINKDVEEEAFVLQNVWLSEEEILDFLSYWLKFYEDEDLYVLYCRTQEKLKRDLAFLKQQAEKKRNKQKKGESMAKILHPLTLLREEEEKINIQEEINSSGNLKGGEGQDQESRQPVLGQHLNIFEKFQRRKFINEGQTATADIKVEDKQKSKPATKKQLLFRKLQQLFEYGCKSRYPLPIGSTFDKISSETKTMNLQKFINFCNCFNVNSILSRDLLTEVFKINALNRLTIDQKRFGKIIQALIEADQSVVDKFLGRPTIKKTLRKEKSQFSTYKFSIQPMNGKNVQSIEEQLQNMRLLKSKSREEKMKNYIMKKVKEKEKLTVHKKQKSMSIDRIMPKSTSINQLQNMRDEKFDPYLFVGNDFDEVLSIYQSKLEPQFKTIQRIGSSALESILSKRLERGKQVLKKIDSSMRLYE